MEKTTQLSFFDHMALSVKTAIESISPDSTGRARRRFVFWLDVIKPSENYIGRKLEALKKSKQYTQTIRSGILLLLSLQAGDTTYLKQLFPGIITAIKQETQTQIAALKSTIEMQETKIGELQTEIQRLKAQDNFEQIIERAIKRNMPAASPVLQPIATIKPIEMKAVAAPDEDDDLVLVVQKDEGAGARASANFLKSLSALQQ